FLGNLGLAIDAGGNLFVSEYNNHRVRRIDGRSGAVTTVAGDGTAGNGGDQGPGPLARIFQPLQIVGSGTEVLFADVGNRAVRVLWGVASSAPTAATITLVGGDGQLPHPSAPIDTMEVRVIADGAPVPHAAVRWEVVDP